MEKEAMVNDQITNKRGNKTKKILLSVLGVFVLGFLVLVFLFIQDERQTPDESTFYLGEYKDQPILFYRYADMIVKHNAAPRTIGHIVPLDRPYNIKVDPKTYIDFKDLKKAKKIFNFERHAGIQNYMLNKEKDSLIISYIGGAKDTTNYIYQFNLKSGDAKKVWEHEIRDGRNPYKGLAHITQFIPDEYVVFALIGPNPPPQKMPFDVVIQNIQSGKGKSLGQVGGINIDLNNKEVTYQKLALTKVPCEGKDDSDCFKTDTYKHAFLPSGERFTAALP